MTKTLRGASTGAPFFGPSNEHPASAGCSVSPRNRGRKLQQPGRSGKKEQFIDAIVGGERVKIAQPKESERGLMLRIRVAIATMPGVLIWRNEVAKARRLSDNQIMPFGLGVGSADLIGIVAPHGRLLGVEVKLPRTGRVSPEQNRWMRVVREHGGVAGIATTVEEAVALVEEARRA